MEGIQEKREVSIVFEPSPRMRHFLVSNESRVFELVSDVDRRFLVAVCLTIVVPLEMFWVILSLSSCVSWLLR